MSQAQFWTLMMPLLFIISGGIGTLITIGFKKLFKLLDTKTDAIVDDIDRKAVKDLLSQVEDHISTAVVDTNDTLVDNLKKASLDGTLTQAEIITAFSQTYATAKKLIGDETYEQLKELLPDVETWMQSKIRFYVKLNK